MRWLLILLTLLIIIPTGCTPAARARAADAGPTEPEYTLDDWYQGILSDEVWQRTSAISDIRRLSAEDAQRTIPSLEELALSDPEGRVRSSALRKVFDLAEDPAAHLELFTAAMDDPEEYVRTRAIQLLGWLGPGAQPAAQQLLAQFMDNRDTAGDAAADALRNIDPGLLLSQVPEYLNQLKYGNPGQRAAAAYALGCIGPVTDGEVTSYDWAEMERYRPPRPPGSYRIYSSASFTIDKSLPPVSGRLDPRVSQVPAALKQAVAADPDPAVRTMAVRSLGRFQRYSLGSLELLIEQLESADVRNFDLREATLTALAEIGPSGRLDAADMATVLDTTEYFETREALRVLREYEGDRTAALPRLRELIQETDNSNDLGMDICEVIKTMGAQAAPLVPDLIEAQRDDFFITSSSFVEALGHIGPAAAKAIPFLTEVLEAGNSDSGFAAVSLALIDPAGQTVAPVLARHLQDNQQIGIGCAIGLAKLDSLPAEAVTALLEAIAADCSAGACCHALRAQAATYPEVIPVMVGALQTSEYGGAMIALALVQNGEAFPELVPGIIGQLEEAGLLQDYRGALVAGWLTEDDDEAVGFLELALNEGDRTSRQLAALGLAQRGPAAAAVLPSLAACTTADDGVLQLYAAYAVTQADPAAIGPFIPLMERWLYQPHGEFRQYVIWVAGEAGAAAAPLLPALRCRALDPIQESSYAAVMAVHRIEGELRPGTDS